MSRGAAPGRIGVEEWRSCWAKVDGEILKAAFFFEPLYSAIVYQLFGLETANLLVGGA
jgi:hypothetical protein